MKPPSKPPSAAKPSYRGAESKAEKDRLAKALRQNLLRRKSAASGRKPS